MNSALIQNSLFLVVAVAVLSSGMGWVVALVLQRVGARLRTILFGGTGLTLILPGFFVAGMWMEHLGFVGAWRYAAGTRFERWMPMLVTTAILALMLWPVVALMMSEACRSADLRAMEAEPELKGLAMLRHALWPQVRTAAAFSALLVGILAAGNFQVPALFQARVWAAEVWVEYATRYDAWAAWHRYWPMMLVVLGLAAWLTRCRVAWPARSLSDRRHLLVPRLGSFTRVALTGSAWVVMVLALVFPVGNALAVGQTWTELPVAFEASWPASLRSLAYASVSASLAVGLSLFLGRFPWGVVTALPFVLPGVFTGIAMASAPVVGGSALLRDSGGALVVGLTLRYTFVGWLIMRQAWRSADTRCFEWLRLHGGRGWSVFRHAVWPRARGQAAAAWYLVFLLGLWDVETQILLVPPGGDSLSVMIFNLLHYGHNAQVTALCVMLGIVAVVPFMLIGMARRIGESPRFAVSMLIGGAGLLGSSCSKTEGVGNGHRVTSKMFEGVVILGSKGTGPGRFSKPRSVAVDARNHVYAVDMTGRVQHFGASGDWIGLWQMPETALGKPKGMDVRPGGGVLVVEPHYHRVNQYDPDGRSLGFWGEHGLGDGQLWFPRSVAVASDGTCFVSEYGRRERVQKFRLKDGAFVLSFGSAGTGPGQFNRAEGLGVGPRDEVFVADSCNHRIQVFTSEGRFLRMHGGAGRGAGQMSYPYDVRVDAEGRQYVCEFGNSRIQVFDADDRPLETLGGPGSGPNALSNPWSLCLGSDGDLYIADSQNHRIVRYQRRRSAGVAAGAPRGRAARDDSVEEMMKEL